MVYGITSGLPFSGAVGRLRAETVRTAQGLKETYSTQSWTKLFPILFTVWVVPTESKYTIDTVTIVVVCLFQIQQLTTQFLGL